MLKFTLKLDFGSSQKGIENLCLKDLKYTKQGNGRIEIICEAMQAVKLIS